MREGELAALLRSDVVDLEGADPHLTVTKSWTDATTKTGKSRRVSLVPAAVKALRAWLAHWQRLQDLWGHIYACGHDWGWAHHIDSRAARAGSECRNAHAFVARSGSITFATRARATCSPAPGDARARSQKSRRYSVTRRRG